MRRYIVIAGLVTLTLFCAGFARSTATRSAGQTRLAKATAPATSRRATSGEPYNQAVGLGIPDLTKLASDLTS